MIEPKIFEQVIKRLQSSKKVLCVAHVDPDGDAFGSAVAMAKICEYLQVPADIYCASEIPESLLPFSYGKKIIHSVQKQDEYDCVVVNDCGDAKRVNLEMPIAINVDHHLGNKVPAQINVIDPDSTSTGMVIYQMIRHAGIPLTKELGTLFYLTILCDTGSFRWDNSTAEVFEACSQFVAAGAKPYQIYATLNESDPAEKIKTMGEGLANLQVTHHGKTVYTVLKNKPSEHISGIVDQMRKIKSSEIVVLFDELANGEIKLSFRSKYDKNIQPVAAKFNGGGHAKAAGAQIKGDLKSIVQAVLEEIEKLY